MPQEEIPGFVRVDHRWTADEWWSAVRCRLGRFGERSRVPPGLYALGRPGTETSVVATASYRLSFDVLRRGLSGTDCWILVVDTRGLDVASAAAAGRFSTDELATRVLASRLSKVVRHRRLILPMRAAAAVDSAALARATGFEALLGPDRAADLPAFLSSHSLPVVWFGVRDALSLTPVELGLSLLRFPAFAFAALLFAGLGPGGVNLDRALRGSWPLLALGLLAIACGSLLAPLLHAAVTAVPLWATGLAAGLAGTAALMAGAAFTVLSDKIVIRSVLVVAPNGHFEGNPFSGNNLGKIMQNVNTATKSGGPGSTNATAGADNKPGQKIEVDDFLITGAMVHVSLSGMGGKEMTLLVPDIHFTDLGKSGKRHHRG